MNLQNSPIMEAIIEARFAEKGLDFNQIHDEISIESSFKKKDEIKVVEIKLTPGVSNKPFVEARENKEIGIQYYSEEKIATVQITNDYVSVNKLPTYTNWDSFYEIFSEMVSGLNYPFKRISTRFINKFETPVNKLNHFIRNIPNLSSDKYALAINRGLENFHISCPEISAQAKVNKILTVKLVDGEKRVEIIFDIDVLKNIEIIDKEEMKKHFEQLRKLKNDIFFSNIGDEAKEEFL